MKKSAIIMAANSNYSIGVAITIMSIEEKSPELADSYIIYNDDFDDNTINFIKTLSNKVQFIRYDKKTFEKEYSDLLQNSKIQKFISRYSYFKLIFPTYWNLLTKYDQIIFMDSDLIVLDDVFDLKKINGIGWRPGYIYIKHKDKVLAQPNGGLLIFNNKLPINKMNESFLQHIKNGHSDEQSLVRMTIDLNLELTMLPMQYNLGTHLLGKLNNLTGLKIIHCVGEKKIWNYSLYQYLFPEYVPYLNKAESLNKNKKFFNCNFASRFNFIKSLILTESDNIESIEIYNKHIKLLIDLKTPKYIYLYKDFKKIYFMSINSGYQSYRIYFKNDDRTTYKIVDFINTRFEYREIISTYKYYVYNENMEAFYVDCPLNKYKDMINAFINDFSYILEKYISE